MFYSICSSVYVLLCMFYCVCSSVYVLVCMFYCVCSTVHFLACACMFVPLNVCVCVSVSVPTMAMSQLHGEVCLYMYVCTSVRSAERRVGKV